MVIFLACVLIVTIIVRLVVDIVGEITFLRRRRK